MTEILTESFCERCGTRYTFESARSRTRLKGVRVLSRGLKNFVLSDDTSMDEAMAAARSETDREATSNQLDAFHKTFNFCMQCRQYTCPNCWNEAEARCLTCAPHLGQEIMPAPFPDLTAPSFLVARTASTNGTNGSHDGVETADGFELAEAEAAAVVETGIDLEADDDIDIAARLDALTVAPAVVVPPFPREVWEAEPTEPEVVAVEVEPEPVVEPEPIAVAAEPVAEPEPIAVAAEPVAEPEPIAAPAAEPARETTTVADLAAAAIIADGLTPEEKASKQTSGLFRRFRPGQDLNAELDAYERERTAAVPAAGAVAAAGHVANVGEEADTPIEAAAVAEPGAVAEPQAVAPAEPQIAPAATPPEPAAPVADDIIKQPTWRMVAPDPTPTAPPESATLPAAATKAPTAEPQWPTRPEWAGSTPAAGLPFLGRPATPEGGLEALWAASTRDLVTGPTPDRPATGIQPCVSCGLSLSATARFCRRCGASQVG